jgi:hypothetical protein
VGGVRYSRYDYLAEKRAALDGWARKLAEIIEGYIGGKVVQLKHKAK